MYIHTVQDQIKDWRSDAALGRRRESQLTKKKHSIYQTVYN